MEFLYTFVGLLAGALLVFWRASIQTARIRAEAGSNLRDAELKHAENLKTSDIDKAMAIQKSEMLQNELESLTVRLNDVINENQKLASALGIAEANNKNTLEKLNEQKTEVEKMHQKLNTEFENIASRILRQNSNDITEIHNKNINILLQPFKEKITAFEKKVEDTYDKELREKNDLRTEIKILHELNKRISDEANNLTKALKGDSKKQGNWGEIILERILERSGLNKGQEYEMQYSTQSEENKRIQPDVVIFLPEKKHLIIDSKVSLIAYERFINADNDEDRSKYIREHVNSVKTHITQLSEKKYQNAGEFITPDFVLMFLPVESSFSSAMQADNELFSYGWERKIVIVSPTTLLATLRTIASVWRQENQTRNALEIARQGGALYDKLVAFVNDLEKVGKNIEGLSTVYNEAVKKLHTGNGNLITRAENIRKLGARASKNLPEKFTGTETLPDNDEQIS